MHLAAANGIIASYRALRTGWVFRHDSTLSDMEHCQQWSAQMKTLCIGLLGMMAQVMSSLATGHKPWPFLWPAAVASVAGLVLIITGIRAIRVADAVRQFLGRSLSLSFESVCDLHRQRAVTNIRFELMPDSARRREQRWRTQARWLASARRRLRTPLPDYLLAIRLRTFWEAICAAGFVVFLCTAYVDKLFGNAVSHLPFMAGILGMMLWTGHRSGQANAICETFEALAPQNLAEVFPETENLLASHG